MARHAAELKNTDPSSVDYARILEEIERDSRHVMELLPATAALLLVSLSLDFAKQILAFSAASTTYSGGRRYSLAGLLGALTAKGGALSIKGPSITIAVAAALKLSCAVLLGAPLSAMMVMGPDYSSRSGVISAIQGLLFVLRSIASLCFNVVTLVGVAASVADGGGACRGVRALWRAWRLMTRVRRKEGFVLALAAHLLAAHLLPALLTPLYAKKSLAMGLCVQSFYALLSSAFQLFSIAAATVYYYQAMEAMESKEGMSACGYLKIV